MRLSRDVKRSITYSVLTVIFFIIAKIYDIGDEESIVAYLAAIVYLVTGFVSIWFLGKIISKSFKTFISNK